MANLLFTWAKAIVFAKVYNREYYIFGWSKFHIGPYLRGERVKRYYGDYFKGKGGLLTRIRFRNLKKRNPDIFQIEPVLESVDESKHFVFDLIPFPDQKPYFHDIRNYREYIKSAFDEMLKPKYKLKLNVETDIAVHIRRGDFQNNFRYLPDSYYVDCINRIRKKIGKNLNVTVYTDGYAKDVQEVLALPNTKLSEIKKDIFEFQALSQCKILITSFDSTFGYWAGFLSNAHIILHPKHFGGKIRESSFPKFEGTVDEFIALQKIDLESN